MVIVAFGPDSELIDSGYLDSTTLLPHVTFSRPGHENLKAGFRQGVCFAEGFLNIVSEGL